ncbi:alpha/beta hydrolase [Aspergillus foveolatus]|uniref:alpha/beta hydrolase n=1 Tax=Aspergillus foveolatus TaxID=210207 RepID=UPI003CCDCD3B
MSLNLSVRRTFRVLMLHGYAQSSEVFRVKARLVVEQVTRSLTPLIEDEYPDGLEFIFPDAPLRLNGPEGHEQTGLEYRAWWLNLDDTSNYIGFDRAIIGISESLDHRPIHAVIGFSQGGALAAMVASLCEAASNPDRQKSLLEQQGQLLSHSPFHHIPGQRPLRFVICFSGFRGTMKYYSSFYTPLLSPPSLHIIGTLDTMITDRQSQDLVDAFKRQKILYHDGGHYIPRDPQLLERVGLFISNAYHLRPAPDEEKCIIPCLPSQSGGVGIGFVRSRVKCRQILRRRKTRICVYP